MERKFRSDRGASAASQKSAVMTTHSSLEKTRPSTKVGRRPAGGGVAAVAAAPSSFFSSASAEAAGRAATVESPLARRKCSTAEAWEWWEVYWTLT